MRVVLDSERLQIKSAHELNHRIDLDIESKSAGHYDAMLKKLRSHFATDKSKKCAVSILCRAISATESDSTRYYLTAAPQCEFPDANLGRCVLVQCAILYS